MELYLHFPNVSMAWYLSNRYFFIEWYLVKHIDYFTITFTDAMVSHHHRVQTGSGAHPASYANSYWVLLLRGVKLTSHLHIVSRLRMCGAIPPLPICFHSVVLR
jgi:hypothetical protein